MLKDDDWAVMLDAKMADEMELCLVYGTVVKKVLLRVD